MHNFIQNQQGKMPFKMVVLGFAIIVAAVSIGIFWQMRGIGGIGGNKKMNFELGKKYDEPLIVESFGNILSFLPVGASPAQAQELAENKVQYIEAYAKTDVVQTREKYKLKEDIVLKAVGHPQEFRYKFSAENFDWEKNENGDLIFYKKGVDKNLARLFTIPAPFMIGADENDKGYVGMFIEGDELVLRPDMEWIQKHTYPIILDPTVEINILNLYSHPEQGDNWEVEFTTLGQADLKIIPSDQDTIDDDEFMGLYCDEEKMSAQVLAGDVIYYKNWQCDGIGEVAHYTKKAGKHTLRFEFNNQIVFAYNDENNKFDVQWNLIKDYPTEKIWQVTITNPYNLSPAQDVSVVVDNADVALNSSDVLVERIVEEEYFVKEPIFGKEATVRVIENVKSFKEKDGYLEIKKDKSKKSEEEEEEEALNPERDEYYYLDQVISHTMLDDTTMQLEYYLDVKIGEKDVKKVRNKWQAWTEGNKSNNGKKMQTNYGSLTLPSENEEQTWQVTIKNLDFAGKYFGNSGKIALWIDGVEYHPWWDSSWLNRRKITINNTVSASTLTNFPVLVQIMQEDTSRIDYTKTQNAGEDIRFVNYNGTALDYEIEKWDETATSTMWVEIPSIEGSTTTQYFYMYYNNTGASTNSSSTAVWDSNYMMVQHLEEGDSTAANFYTDSTTNHNNCTLTDADGDSAVDTRIAGAFNFNGDADIMNCPYINLTGAYSIFLWASDELAGWNYWLGQHQIGQTNKSMHLGVKTAGNIFHNWFYNDLATTDTFSDNVWRAVEYTFNGSNSRITYVNSVSKANDNPGTTFAGASGNTTIGGYLGESAYYNGSIDEVRISNTERSLDWVEAEYTTMIDTYLSYESEESGNSAPTILSVTDLPDPIGTGSEVIFMIDWNDADTGEMIQTVICQGSGITTSTAVCKDGEWARSPVYTNRDPENQAKYITVAADKGNTRNYWAFVCDDGAACSAGTAGTFTVENQRPDEPISLLIEGKEIGNAINIDDATPEFSAIYKDTSDEGDVSAKYCIEVDTQSDFGGTDMWISDSASCYVGLAVGTAVADGTRSEDFSYAGTALSLDGTIYYWRMWFWDGEERSATSTMGWFNLANQSAGWGTRLNGKIRLNGGIRFK